jgi:hypothetical protein|tara:strand:- start:214 stop:477 length:264 start_codon:yes stop_codon:yes gene_type:complete
MGDKRTNLLDPSTGVVHAQFAYGDGEFTFCNLTTDGDEGTGGFIPQLTGRPVDCHECRKGWQEIKRSLVGIYWAREVVTADRGDVHV